MNEEDAIFINALNICSAPNADYTSNLLKLFPSPKDAFYASKTDLIQAGFLSKATDRVEKNKETIDPHKEWDRLKKENIRCVGQKDKEYPSLLKQIAKPPTLLYIKGNTEAMEPFLAVVGTRWPSEYGELATHSILPDLIEHGFTIVSGMARGIDTLAHKECLARKKPTIAVLGTGIDIPYPPENKSLYNEIIKYGAVISEYPMGVQATQFTFPKRNEIIAGIAQGTIVIEAKSKSGALITASLAAEYGRDVFAVPGSIFAKNSTGTNNLIKNGAYAITSANDIIAKYDLTLFAREQKIPRSLDVNEQKIIDALSQEALDIDSLAKATRLPISIVSSALIIMEIKGTIIHAGNIYQLKK